MVQVKARGDVEEIDSDSDEDNPKVGPPSLKEMIAACQMLEENGLLVCTDALNIIEAVYQFQGHLHKMRVEKVRHRQVLDSQVDIVLVIFLK